MREEVVGLSIVASLAIRALERLGNGVLPTAIIGLMRALRRSRPTASAMSTSREAEYCSSSLFLAAAACSAVSASEGMTNTLSEMCVTAERFLTPERYLTAERMAERPAERFLAPERYLTAARSTALGAGNHFLKHVKSGNSISNKNHR